MSRKNIIIYASLILVCIFGITCSSNGGYKQTPDQYKSVVQVPKEIYKVDTAKVYGILKKMVNLNINPFTSKSDYDNESQLYIDSLIYSPDRLRMIVFVIIKNDTKKLALKENDERYYFNGYYLFCSRDSLLKPIKVYDQSSFRLSNFYSYSEIRDALHEYCFLQLYSESTPEEIHYNIDDKRFWNSKDFDWVLKNSKAIIND